MRPAGAWRLIRLPTAADICSLPRNSNVKSRWRFMLILFGLLLGALTFARLFCGSLRGTLAHRVGGHTARAYCAPFKPHGASTAWTRLFGESGIPPFFIRAPARSPHFAQRVGRLLRGTNPRPSMVPPSFTSVDPLRGRHAFIQEAME